MYDLVDKNASVGDVVPALQRKRRLNVDLNTADARFRHLVEEEEEDEEREEEEEE